MSGERRLRNHLRWRITNASDTFSKIFHQQTVSWGDPETLDRAVFAALGFALSLVGQRWVGPSPSPGGGRPRRAESGPSQLSLRGPRLLSTPSLTRTSGPPPPPPRLRLRPLKSQHRRATWARPAGQLRAGRRVAALRGRPGELSGVCWSPRCATGEGMIADFLCLPSGGGGGRGEGRRRRAEATVQGSAGGQQGRRCACL